MTVVQAPVVELDVSRATVRDVNARLQAANSGEQIRVTRPAGCHAIAAGVTAEIDVQIDGDVGYYCAGMSERATVTVRGHAGVGLAENLMSGSVLVRRNAGQAAGASAHGGLIVIGGDAAARCGIALKGADVVVRGSVGHMTGFMAQAGRLVICGDAGEALGDSIYEAQIYVRGAGGRSAPTASRRRCARSTAPNCKRCLRRATAAFPRRRFAGTAQRVVCTISAPRTTDGGVRRPRIRDLRRGYAARDPPRGRNWRVRDSRSRCQATSSSLRRSGVSRRERFAVPPRGLPRDVRHRRDPGYAPPGTAA